MTTISNVNLAKNFRANIIIPTLNRIGLYSLAAEKMLMGTAAIESRFVFQHQIIKGGKVGIAIGFFQMEPSTFNYLIEKKLVEKRNQKLLSAVLSFCGGRDPSPWFMLNNPCFAAAMARVRYDVVPEPIPLTVNGQAHYWKKYYNGNARHGLSAQDYINRWNELCAPVYG